MAKWEIDGDLITTHIFEVEADTYDDALVLASEMIHGGLVDSYTTDLWLDAHEVKEDEDA